MNGAKPVSPVTVILPIGTPPQLELGTTYNPKLNSSEVSIIKLCVIPEHPPKSSARRK